MCRMTARIGAYLQELGLTQQEEHRYPSMNAPLLCAQAAGVPSNKFNKCAASRPSLARVRLAVRVLPVSAVTGAAARGCM